MAFFLMTQVKLGTGIGVFSVSESTLAEDPLKSTQIKSHPLFVLGGIATSGRYIREWISRNIPTIPIVLYNRDILSRDKDSSVLGSAAVDPR